MEEENLLIAEDVMLAIIAMQNFCEKTEDKEFNKQAFSIKFKILLLIKKLGSISPSALVENLNIAKSNIALFSSELIKSGLIESKHDEFDRRIIYYCLTPKGITYVESFVAILNKHICLNLDEKQQKSLYKNAKAINNNLDKLTKTGAK